MSGCFYIPEVSSNNPYSAIIPSNPSMGCTITQKDPVSNAPIQYFWNGTEWVSTQLFTAGADISGTSGLLVISGVADYTKVIPSIGLTNKVWLERFTVSCKQTGTLGVNVGSNYFTVSQNTLTGIDSNNDAITWNGPIDFSTQNVTLNKYYVWSKTVGQTFNGRLDNWLIKFGKTGLGLIQITINPVLEYRLIKP